MTEALVRLRDVTRSYGSPPLSALAGVDLDIDRGELVAIVGASGSGKSTLLNIIGTLDRPTSGTVHIGGMDTNRLSDVELSSLRSRAIGFVFQQFHLRDGVTAIENVADGLLYSGTARAHRRVLAAEALERVGLGHRMRHEPNQMSGGERQRVAIARAVIGEPPILLADEPTGNLDSRSGEGVVELLHSLHADGTSVIVITHDAELAAMLPRRVAISDGTVLHDSRPKAV
jgi:putative ABC transport system ATP-binding protein